MFIAYDFDYIADVYAITKVFNLIITNIIYIFKIILKIYKSDLFLFATNC